MNFTAIITLLSLITFSFSAHADSKQDKLEDLTMPDHFIDKVLKKKGRVAVFFTAYWCDACHEAEPKLAQFSKNTGFDILAMRELKDDAKGKWFSKIEKHYQSTLRPTVLLFEDGELKGMLTGGQVGDIKAFSSFLGKPSFPDWLTRKNYDQVKLKRLQEKVTFNKDLETKLLKFDEKIGKSKQCGKDVLEDEYGLKLIDQGFEFKAVHFREYLWYKRNSQNRRVNIIAEYRKPSKKVKPRFVVYDCWFDNTSTASLKSLKAKKGRKAAKKKKSKEKGIY